MKKYFYLFIILFILCVPYVRVDAIVCNSSILTVEDINFMCAGIEGESLTFTFNGQDYSQYFTLSGKTVNINPSISFPSDVEIANIEVKDSAGSTFIRIKNSNYIAPKTTTTTTTQVPDNIVEVLFDKNDGSELIVKRCSIVSGSDYCSVVIPKLDIDGFNGWGTQKTCKEGISGTIKIYENITYYACYSNEEESNDNNLILKNLSILDKDTLENIDYGELNLTNNSYTFKVLYEVDNIIINAVGDENIKVNINHDGSLSVGNNKILIILSDEDGNQKDYTLNVERLNEGESLSSIHYLSSLDISGFDINFDKEKFNYTLKVEKEIESLLINNPIPLNENDTVNIKGNENLINNSKVFIEVSGIDGVVTTYTINIIKEESSNNSIFIGLIGLLIIVIICVLLFIIKRKSKNDFINKKIKKVKKDNKNNGPEVLVTENKNDNIEVLKF